jgi:outer membrane receptor protein involved in Fe transport
VKTTSILKLAAAPCALAAALCAAPVLAQSPTAECIDADADGACDVPASADGSVGERNLIIVTGSRIPQPNLESANPVAVVTGEDIFETGNTSVGDQLNDLPQLRSTYSQQNSTRNLGNRGLNLVDLRGLGQDNSPRTLVLVNGRRHVASDVLLSGAQVDVNTIPLDLVSRIDVVTGGASGVYGSDAIAGVVNFVLKDDYEGLALHGQNGISKYGDAGNQYISLVAGQNFADGRGNLAVDLEFSHQQDYYGSGRPNLRTNNTFVLVDNDPGGSANGAADGPDRLFFRDVRAATISLGGLVLVREPAGGPCGSGDGLPFGCTFLAPARTAPSSEATAVRRHAPGRAGCWSSRPISSATPPT